MTENTDAAVEVDTAAEEATTVVDENVGTVEAPEADDASADAEQFPREYVEKLRSENAKYRERARLGDTYAQRLHVEIVRATGRLADPTDLAFDDAHLDDGEALAAAIDDLLSRKPHLASRRPVGEVGQGERGVTAGPVNLLNLLKSRS